MPTSTIKPTSGSGSSWQNIARAYDTNTTTAATVSIRGSNYSSRTATFNWDLSNITSNPNIILNSAIMTMYADMGGDTTQRAINMALTTTQANYTADVTDYIRGLSGPSVKLTGYMTSTSSTTFSVYDVKLDIDYTLSKVKNGTSIAKSIRLGTEPIKKLYLGTTLLYDAGDGSSSGGDTGGGNTGGGTDTSGITIVEYGSITARNETNTLTNPRIVSGLQSTTGITKVELEIGLQDTSAQAGSLVVVDIYYNNSSILNFFLTLGSNKTVLAKDEVTNEFASFLNGNALGMSTLSVDTFCSGNCKITTFKLHIYHSNKGS